MKLLAFSIYDEKAEAFSNPFYSPADGLAARMFQDLCQNNQTTVGNHPTDFTLYRIGTFNTHSAELASHTPVFIMKGATWKPDQAEEKESPSTAQTMCAVPSNT